MPIGAAVGVGLAGAAGTAVAGKSNAKAINKSTEAQTQSNAQSLALQGRIYDQNAATLSPFIGRGNVAGQTFNALLGLGGVPANDTQGLPASQPQTAIPYGAMGGGQNALAQAKPWLSSGFGGSGVQFAGPQQLPQQANALAAPAMQRPGQTPLQAANDAFDIYRNSAGYQFRLGEGMNALNSGWAGAGTLQSGAAMRDAIQYGQDYASNEFGNYLGYLGNQQGVGLSAASAQAGVGQGYANNVTAINQNNANALGASAVARANNTNAMIGGFGNALGQSVGILQGAGKL